MSALDLSAGSIELPDAVVNAFDAAWKTVAMWRGPARPTECKLAVAYLTDIEPGGTVVYPGRGALGFVGSHYKHLGVDYVWRPLLGGAFRLTYGRGGASRRVVCDLRTASLFLGTCDYVSVEAMRWRTDAPATIPPTVNASASIAPSFGGAYDEATCTVIQTFPSGSAVNKACYLPPHATYFAPFVGDDVPGASNYWGGTNPDIRFIAAGQTVVHRPSQYQVVPNLPRYELGYYQTLHFAQVISAAALTSALVIGIRFYLST